MFGIFYLVANTIGTMISGGIAAKENYDARQKGYEKQAHGKNRAGIYTDRLGGTRRLSDNKRVMMDNLYCSEAKGEDCYMRDQYGHPIRNMSEEIRQERMREAKEKNDPRISVVEWKQGVPRSLAGIHGRPYCAGKQYKDLQDGKIYVCRILTIPKELSNGESFSGIYYMNMNTGLLVREADSSKERTKRKGRGPSEELSQKFISYFNEKQSAEGYVKKSKNPRPEDLDMDGKESEFDKRIRLGWYFCNDYEISDIV